MKSEELQHLTASEPLTLEQEYEMQQSWQIDENSKPTTLVLNNKNNLTKQFLECTFIILDREKFQSSNGNEVG